MKYLQVYMYVDLRLKIDKIEADAFFLLLYINIEVTFMNDYGIYHCC